ncbi:MAG TPA: alkaline phosphatase family protein [Candidatus Binataceae bacterium]|nr:alkaline phosphatase family protein [Candidatus Binataceae bacterium]
MKSFRVFLLLLLSLMASAVHISAAVTARPRGRIFILMVWDGLRPDFVTPLDTPNLFALERDGVSFPQHHAVFPSVTMVNAAALATGYPPGGTGIFGDALYVPPALAKSSFEPPLSWIAKPVNLESTVRLIALNQPGLLNGRLLDAKSIGQRVQQAHGYVAAAGKSGPTFLFDPDQFTNLTRGPDGQGHLLMASDVPAPPALDKKIGPLPEKSVGDVPFVARDAWYTDAVVADALPGAITASNRGRPALIVLWQRNPDITQHMAGLGTEEALEALTRDDQNLGRLRAAITAHHIADRTDLMVVSDHGFVTLGDAIRLPDLLISAGLKKSKDSDDVVTIGDQGSELIYLSPAAFPNPADRQARLQKIVDFVAAQDWCGPIFSHSPASGSKSTPAHGGDGWIKGTFDERTIGLDDSRRSPDLIISMRENSDQSNRTLTGPDNPAFFVGPNGRQAVKNRSQSLVRPVLGTLDGDVSEKFSTGMGGHGAAGRRELHNFCAAAGPDFRRHFLDPDPTGNIDVAPTIAYVLGLRPEHAANATAGGRVMTEALTHGSHHHLTPVAITMTAHLALPQSEVETKLLFTQVGSHHYLDDAAVEREPLRAATANP